MKVLHVIDNLYVGGAERVMVNLCNWQHNVGLCVQVAIISGRGNDLLHLIHKEIPVHEVGRKKRLDYLSARKLYFLLKDSDIVHVHMRHNYRYVRLISYWLGIKVRIILHDHSSSETILFGLNSIFKPKYFIGTSTFSMQFAKSMLNMKSNCFMLENVIETINTKSVEKKEGFVLVSNIKEGKNQIFALNILRHFHQKLDFYGVVQSKTYLEKINEYALEYDILKKIEFFTGENNVQSILCNYEFGLHTSANETGPLTIIEYLAQGLPFIAYRTGEAAEKISQEFPEFFMDNFEVEEWVTRIQSILSAPPSKEKMQQVFAKHFSKKNYIEKCLKIYESVLHS